MLKFVLKCLFALILCYFLFSSWVGKLLCVLIFAFIYIFIHYSKLMKYQYGIDMIVGQIGVGKSSILCSIIRKYIKKGWHVYADFETNIPSCRYYDPKKLDKYLPEKHSLVICDEASLQFFCRSFATFQPYTDFFAKCRHQHCRVIMSSQTFDVDKYIRDRVSRMFLVKRIGCIAYMRQVTKLQEVLSAESLSNAYDVRNSGLVDGFKYASLMKKDSFKVYWLPALWKWHDSFYMDEKPEIEYSVPCTEDPFKDEKWYIRLKNSFFPAVAKPHDDDAAQLEECDQALPDHIDDDDDACSDLLDGYDDVFLPDSVPRIRH